MQASYSLAIFPALKASLLAEAAGVPQRGGPATGPLRICPHSRERNHTRGASVPRRGQVRLRSLPEFKRSLANSVYSRKSASFALSK